VFEVVVVAVGFVVVVVVEIDFVVAAAIVVEMRPGAGCLVPWDCCLA